MASTVKQLGLGRNLSLGKSVKEERSLPPSHHYLFFPHHHPHFFAFFWEICLKSEVITCIPLPLINQ